MKLAYQHACFCILLIIVSQTVLAQASFSDNTIIFSTENAVSFPDSNKLFTIRGISISGNIKTRSAIILRELSFNVNEGYSLNMLADKFNGARKQLINTGLFHKVVVSLKSLHDYDVDVNIEVDEKWYLYPIPFIRPVDKTFQQWWCEENRNMDRINYGIRLAHNNFTGRNDKLRINLMNGYTQQVSVQYYGLFLDKKLKWSTNAGIAFGGNKEINYMTLNNKQVPIKNNDQYLLYYFNSFLEVSYRPAIKARHTFGIAYNYENVADTIFKLNPYFSAKPNIVRYPEISYRFSYTDVDFIAYPTDGHIIELTFKKKGFNDPINLCELTAKGSVTRHAGQKSFINLCAVGILKLPFKQPYISKQFIGYNEQYLQGYEYYVIDGLAGGYSKATFTRSVLNTNIGFPSQKIKRLNDIPLKLYVKTFANAGYVYNINAGNNGLTNKFLCSAGVGLDIVIFTDFVIKLEWSFNRLGQNGLYLHQRNYF